jgi:hypothetical protein
MKIKKIGTALIASAFIGRIILQPVTALAANPGDYANCDGFSRDDIYNMLNNAGYTDWYDPVLGSIGAGVTVLTFLTGVGELQAGAKGLSAAAKAAKPLITGSAGKNTAIVARKFTTGIPSGIRTDIINIEHLVSGKLNEKSLLEHLTKKGNYEIKITKDKIKGQDIDNDIKPILANILGADEAEKMATVMKNGEEVTLLIQGSRTGQAQTVIAGYKNTLTSARQQ